MKFIFYDLIFLTIFILAIVLFLYIHRSRLKREGIMYLYRTNIGIKIINWTAKKYSRLLSVLQYIIIACGYILMIVMTYLLGKLSYEYIISPTLAQTLKVPVLMPLIPYVDKLFPEGILPPFYFTYWIIIIAVIAIPHEFAHGIYSRFHNIKVKSTGFGFLGPFLAAFVEPDEKQLNKSKKISQLSILAAGTFANILFSIIFALVLWAFFVSAFSPAGIIFNTYSMSAINISDIPSNDGISLKTVVFKETNTTLFKIEVNNQIYLIVPQILEEALKENATEIIAFDDSPAINAQLQGTITEINGKSIKSYQELNQTLLSYSPGNIIKIKTLLSDNENKEYKITLGEKNNKTFLGIGFYNMPKRKGITGFVYSFVTKIKEPLIYYKSSLGDFGFFIYNLLWWLVLINLSVAFFNMIPVGIFDGGRFFLLTIWELTGSKKIGDWAFKLVTWLFLILIALLMLKWVFVVL